MEVDDNLLYVTEVFYDDSLPVVERNQSLPPIVHSGVLEEMPTLSLVEVVLDWSASRRSALFNETLPRVPHFSTLSESQKVVELQATGRANRQ